MGAEQGRENSGERWLTKTGFMFVVVEQSKVFVGRGGDVAIPGFFVVRGQGS